MPCLVEEKARPIPGILFPFDDDIVLSAADILNAGGGSYQHVVFIECVTVCPCGIDVGITFPGQDQRSIFQFGTLYASVPCSPKISKNRGKIKLSTTILSVRVAGSLYAATLPVLPNGCFDDRKRVGPRSGRVIAFDHAPNGTR